MSWLKCSILIILYLSGLTGCATVSVDSENYKATILYFEGGTGEILRGSQNKLINRCSVQFRQEGIIVNYMYVRQSESRGAIRTRTSLEHFKKIQEKVDSLKAEGHKRIWLMGISNGTLSVMHAGALQVENVEGLIIINPRKDMYSPFHRDGVYAKFSNITLPVLVITHELDNSNMKTLSSDMVQHIYRQSPKAEIVVFSGGVVGSGPSATHLTQKYQHGLRGLETEFVQEVVRFIDAVQ
jgi:pimeloyl-ACP methyl ester carboxylesterase